MVVREQQMGVVLPFAAEGEPATRPIVEDLRGLCRQALGRCSRRNVTRAVHRANLVAGCQVGPG